jgi:hypothetical protein
MRHRYGSRTAATAAAFVLLTGGVVSASVTPVFADAGATPKVTGCPQGWLTLSIQKLGSAYHLPSVIDDSANGGNADGMVCGNPLNAQRSETFCGGPCDVTIYSFRDNSLTPAH